MSYVFVLMPPKPPVFYFQKSPISLKSFKLFFKSLQLPQKFSIHIPKNFPQVFCFVQKFSVFRQIPRFVRLQHRLLILFSLPRPFRSELI